MDRASKANAPSLDLYTVVFFYFVTDGYEGSMFDPDIVGEQPPV